MVLTLAFFLCSSVEKSEFTNERQFTNEIELEDLPYLLSEGFVVISVAQHDLVNADSDILRASLTTTSEVIGREVSGQDIDTPIKGT
jgi:hypothetical protein